ncbi:hypothetical protein [uncultured Demequina sp.]|uniref:hypothetical protein n=1 Tax=uncultured Demequina sp. TaxID=693499 RepID=UPI0025DC5701|nr:hypothetical protein [uncultured Demequina sp.]
MTGGLHAELGALRAQHRAESADARPGPEVARTITRRHRARRAWWGGGAAALVALVGAAAWPSVLGALPTASAPSPSPSPVLSITERVVDEITMPFPSIDADEFSPWAYTASPLECGQPLPDPVSVDDDFSVDWELPDAVEISLNNYSGTGVAEARATVSYGGAGDVPATTQPLTALFVDDGVVVGWSPGSYEPRFQTYASGTPWTATWESWGMALACADAGEDLQPLPEGDYWVGFAVQVSASRSHNATQDLLQQGYLVPPAEYLNGYQEGSYECEQTLQWGSPVPITCDPDTLHGVTIDIDAGELTFPYRSSAYVRDVDATFISDTVPAKVETGEDPFQEFRDSLPAYQPPAEMQCEDVYSELTTDRLLLEAERTRTTYAVDNVIDTRAWVYEAQWSEATISLPPTARMWITAEEEVSTGEGEAGVVYGFTGYRTVGWAEVALPSTVAISRFDGPAPLTLTVQDVTWCDGEPSGQVLSPVLVAPLTITIDGETIEAEGVAIWSGGVNF